TEVNAGITAGQSRGTRSRIPVPHNSGQTLEFIAAASQDRRMSSPILVGKAKADLFLLPQMANRHGLIAGATGTGKTVTLQVLAENFSAQGVPVFLADVKGDLAGISQPGGASPKVQQRLAQLKLEGYTFAGCPMTCWDVFGENGHPVRATISEMGPLLLARLL